MSSLQGAALRKTREDTRKSLNRASLGIHLNNDLIDPVTNVDDIPGLSDLKETHHVFEEQREKKKILEGHCQNQLKSKWYNVWLAQGVLALVVTAIVVVLLYLINPPVTQAARKDEFVSEKQNWKAVVGVAVFVFLLVLLLPEFIRLINQLLYKRKMSATAAAAQKDNQSASPSDKTHV